MEAGNSPGIGNQLNRPDLDKIDAILFDFDGVVVQSEHVYDVATRNLAAFYKLDVPPSFFDANRGISASIFYERFKQTFNLEIDDEELVRKGKEFVWQAFSNSVYLTAGFQQFYDKIKAQGKPAALVTATARSLLDEIFQNSGLQLSFDYVVTSSDVQQSKPAPDPYLKACDYLKVNPGSTLVIEDSPTGLVSAKTAGCQTVAITTSYGRDTLKEAHFVVDSFGELEELLTIV